MDAADLAFAGLARQAELVRAGEVSSRELTELYLDRIARLDPRLNAYRVVLAEEALANADAADRRRGDDAPPLNGVPIAIKDDTDVEGQVTAHGSLAHDFVPAADAEVVRRLRAAGTVILGKTNVPELEALPMTESLAFGATCNPWDPARTSGGSSGGSGTAVAAGLCAAALATDGAGSIRIPAAACGLVGLKPQRDRVPMGGNWYGMAVCGALTRGVRDTALFLDAVKDGGPAYADVAAPGALRIAYSVAMPRGATGRLETEQRDAVIATAERLRGLGHHVEERDPDYGNVAANVVTRYLEGVNGDAEGMPHPELLARWTRGLAGLGAQDPRPARAPRPRAGGGRPRQAEHAPRRVRRAAAPDAHAAAAAGGGVARPARAADAQQHGEPHRPPRALEPHGPAGDQRPRRPGGRRLPGRRAARRPARRRAAAAGARRAARGRDRLDGAAPAGARVSELLALATDVAHEAGAGLREAFSRLGDGGLAIHAKSTPTDLVSEADVATERRIRARLEAARPDDAIMGEEGDDRPGTSGLRWVVDPLDGTVNFLFGLPQWCVSVAVEDADGALAGVVYDPMRDETFSATRDGAATLDGAPLGPPARDELATALVATGFGYAADVREAQARVLARLLPRVRDVRRLGAAALDLAWAAAGRVDCYYERGVHHWDVAAGALICARAGLAVRELPPAPPAAAGLLVAPPALADELSAIVTD